MYNEAQCHCDRHDLSYQAVLVEFTFIEDQQSEHDGSDSAWAEPADEQLLGGRHPAAHQCGCDRDNPHHD